MKAILLVSSAQLTMLILPATATAQASSAAAPVGAGADGQAAPAADPVLPASSERSGVGDIVVTASRRSENLQTVPVTISAFQAKQLSALAITSPSDLPQLVSGYSIIRTLAGANSYLRGVGTSNAGFTSESPVALYVDGLYIQNSAAAVFSFNNIERIEVLKGPQGTLYGRNTTGGLISVITRDPNLNKTVVDAAVGYGNYQTVTANLYASVPLTETLAFNVAGTYTHQGEAWGYNVLNGAGVGKLQDQGLQAKLLWEPGAATRVTLRGFYDRTNTDEGVTVAIYPGSVGVDGTTYLGRFRNASREPDYDHQEQYHLSLKIEQDIGLGELTSTTGYVHSRTNLLNVQNGVLGKAVSGQAAATLQAIGLSKSFSEELQLSSKGAGSPFQWIVGAFYYHDDTLAQANVYGTCTGAICAGAPVPTRTTGFPLTRSYSGYADGSYKVTRTTKLTLGVRYTSDHKSLTGNAVPLPGRPNTPAALPASVVLQPGLPFAGNPQGIATDIVNGKLTFRAVLSQDLADQVHSYFSFNRGFRSGGFNPISFTNPPSRPETLDAYEAGIKSDLFDHKLRLDIAGFYYNYTDIQLRSTAPPAPPGSAILYNAASAHIRGVDLDAALAPARGLTINAGMEFLHARFARFPGGTCSFARPITAAVLGGTGSQPCDLSGNRLPSAPDFSFNASASYVLDTAGGPFQFTASDGYKSRSYWEPDNRLSQKAYHLVNASVEWTSLNRHFGVQLFARNLTGTYYFTAASVTGGDDVYAAGAPRTFGFILKYHY